MSFSEAIHSVLNNYANFSGRARRSEYWNFILFNLLVTSALGILLKAAGSSAFAGVITVVESLWSLALFVPSLAVCWRRLHDIGKSGANWFLILIPLVGAIILIVWFCQEGQHGENQYGPDPKEPATRW